MKTLKKMIVFILILICPLMGACSLTQNTRDSKYGVITLRQDNAQNYFRIISASIENTGANISVKLTTGFLEKVDEIRQKVKISFIYTFKAVFKNTNNKIETKEWKDMEFYIEFDVGAAETENIICSETTKVFVVPNCVQVYSSSEVRIQYFKDVSGKIFIPRPVESSSAAI